MTPGAATVGNGTHRIGRLRFALEGAEEGEVMRVSTEIARRVGDWTGALDAALVAVDRPEATVRLEVVEVDLGLLSRSRPLTRQLLAAALGRALADRLGAVSRARPDVPESEPGERTLAAAMRLFLENGRLPWWSPAPDLSALEAAILDLEGAALETVARSVAGALGAPRAARRLLLQVAPVTAMRLLGALPGGSGLVAAWPGADGAAAAGTGSAIEAAVAAITALANGVAADAAQPEKFGGPGPQPRPRTAAAAERGETGGQQPVADRRRDQDHTPPDAPVDDLLLAEDAGLVLVHPYLGELFHKRGLLASGTFRDSAARQRGVHLTAFLALGDAMSRIGFTEPGLLLSKALCGWPLAEPLPRVSLLSAADLAEAEAMLQALIDNWPALGRASPRGLREAFLHRPGRLREDGPRWRLEVERRGVDALLGRLPWGLSVVRLPWMNRAISVDWS